MKMTKTIAAAAAVITMGVSAFATDATQVMQQVYDRVKPDTTQASVEMTLIDKNGSKETRQIGEYGRCKNNLTDAVIMFFAPASVKNTRFLQKENKGADDDKWIFLPALNSTRRVASSEGDKSFVGTDFTYDDMSTREVSADTHEMVKEDEQKNSFDCYVIKSTPVDKNDQYSYRISWVDKKTLIPVYIEMYDKQGKLEKTNTINQIQVVKSASNPSKTYNVPTDNTMVNVQTKHSTQIKMLKIAADIPLKDGFFSPNFLNTGRL